MYKNKSKELEATKDRMRRYRERKGVTETGRNKEGVTEYPAILYALADVEKRAKLRAICQELSNRHLLEEVRYGVSGPCMDIVAEYLTAF